MQCTNLHKLTSLAFAAVRMLVPSGQRNEDEEKSSAQNLAEKSRIFGPRPRIDQYAFSVHGSLQFCYRHRWGADDLCTSTCAKLILTVEQLASPQPQPQPSIVTSPPTAVIVHIRLHSRLPNPIPHLSLQSCPHRHSPASASVHTHDDTERDFAGKIRCVVDARFMCIRMRSCALKHARVPVRMHRTRMRGVVCSRTLFSSVRHGRLVSRSPGNGLLTLFFMRALFLLCSCSSCSRIARHLASSHHRAAVAHSTSSVVDLNVRRSRGERATHKHARNNRNSCSHRLASVLLLLSSSRYSHHHRSQDSSAGAAAAGESSGRL
jgi:hypothetical protein